MEQLFELLKLRPILSIALGFVLSGFLAWLFRDVIAEYLRKKYDLYNPAEIKKAVNDLSAEKLTKGRLSLGFDLDEQLVQKLKQNKNER